ncbi:MAG: hypothetical protein HOE90_07190, partial [Bacteriovoracaceae bacterium]|nr:hypothetical protein [Bacteriovoracaceae bacterium]
MDKLIRHVRGDEGGGLKEFNPACRYVLAKMATAEVERQLRVQKVNRKYPPDEYFDTEMTCQQRRETEGTVKTLWIKHKAKLTLKEACPHEWKLDEQYRQLKDAALVAMKDATEGDSSLANKSIKAKGCKLIDDQYEIYPLYDCRLDCASSDWCTETRGAVTVNPDGSETGVDERVAEIVVEQTTSVEEGDLTAAVTACNKKGPEIVAMGTFDFCSGETLEIMADHYGCTDPNQSNSVIGQMGYFNGSDLDAETKEMYHYVKKFMLDKAWKNTPLQIRSIVLNNRKCNGIIGDDPLLNSSRVPDPYEMSLEDFEHEIEFIPYLEEICTSSPKEPFPFSEPGRKEFFKYLRAQDPHLERKMKARMCCLSMNYQNAEDMQLAAQGAFVMAAAYIPGAVCGVISKNPKCELITRAVGIAGDLYLAWKPYIDEKARYEQIARGVRLGQDPEEVLDAHQILIDQKITMGKFGSILTVAFNIVPILGPKLGDIFRRFGSKNFRLLAKLDEIMTKTRVSPIQKMIEMIRSLKGDSGFMAQLRLDPTVPNGALDEILDKFLREDGKLAFEEGADALVSSLDRLEGKVAPGVLDDIKKFFKGEGSDAPGAPRVAASSVDVPVVDGLAPSSSVARPASIDIPDSPASSGASGPRTTSVDSEPSSRTSRSSASSTAPEVADARSKLPVSKKTGDRVWIDPDTTDVGRIQIIEEDILGRELSPDQRSAILRAHEEPDLRVKVKILKEEAGITDVGERAALIRSNATGDSTVPGQSVEVFGSGRRSGAASDSELVSVREKARAIETRSPPRSDVGLEIQDTYKQGDLITITNSNGSTSTVEYLGVGNKSGSDAVIVREAGQTKPHLVHADQMSARKADTAESFIHTKVDEQQFGTVATSPDSPAPVREKYSGPGGEGRPMVGDEGYQKAQRWSKQDLEEEIARGGPRSDMARDELARREKIPGFDNPSEEPLSAEALAGREQLEADALARRQEAERVRVGQEPPSALDRQTLEERVALGGEDGRLAQQELDRMSRPDGLDNPSERPLSDETLAGREQLDADALARRQEAER